MKRWGIILAILLAVCLLFSFSCAQKAPEPSEHEPYDVLVLGATAGGSAYVISAGLAEVINAHHPWIRATCTETFGSNDNILKMENDPKVFGIVSDLSFWTAKDGGEPFEKKFTNMRVLGLNQISAYNFISMDPAIKTKEDLVGKKIAMGKKGSSISICSEFILGDCWGMLDKVDAQYIGWKEGGQAMKDGLVDAMLVIESISADDAGNAIWADHPSFAELISLKEVYFIAPTAAEVEAGREKKGWPIASYNIPANAFGPNQPEAAGAISVMNAYFADTSMPGEVAYEIMKIQYEYYQEWAGYHNAIKAITPDTLGFAPVSSEGEYHPGALKYLKEKGAKLYFGGNAPPLF